MNIIKSSLLVVSLLIAICGSASAQWVVQTINTTAGFRGLSVVSEKVIWASGTGGTVIKTVDGGATWSVIKVPDAAKLDFRDIEAFDANTAYILSIGNGDSSRIYKTTDGGEHWRLEFQNSDPKAFYDAIACWDSEHCLAMSDPVDGMFVINERSPGHNGFSRKAPSWIGAVRHVAGANGEASFAASGTCIITVGNYSPLSIETGIAKNDAFIVTGGNAARVRTADSGLSWTAAETTIIKGSQGSGIFGIAMFDAKNGVIVGGNYEKPNEKNNNLAFTHDGGQTWTLGDGIPGFRSGVAYLDKNTLFAVGSSGSDMSVDGGKTWRSIDKLSYNAVAAKGKQAIWAVGDRGMVAKNEMIYAWYDILGTLGVGLIILTYILLQIGRLRSEQLAYSLLNAAGASLILVSLYFSFNFPSFIVEFFWLLISLFGIGKYLRRKHKQ